MRWRAEFDIDQVLVVIMWKPWPRSVASVVLLLRHICCRCRVMEDGESHGLCWWGILHGGHE
jgi:hypothetical protein